MEKQCSSQENYCAGDEECCVVGKIFMMRKKIQSFGKVKCCRKKLQVQGQTFLIWKEGSIELRLSWRHYNITENKNTALC